MNKHFEDAWYYMRRAGTHLGAGLREELAPVERRVRAWTGRDVEPEPSRSERVRENVREVERKAQRRAKGAVRDARERIES
ncbi:hypothetical protein DMJ13_05660 [halophilic archaeon]|nr:hypothetical protein DMJ13_05660 [halophilic archaeon]